VFVAEAAAVATDTAATAKQHNDKQQQFNEQH